MLVQNSCEFGAGLLASNLYLSSRRRHTRFDCDWSSDVCSSDLDGSRLFFHNAGASIEGVSRRTVDHAGAVRGTALLRWPALLNEHDALQRHLPNLLRFLCRAAIQGGISGVYPA